MPITVTFGIPQARKILAMLNNASVTDRHLAEAYYALKYELDDLPTPAPWRKVVDTYRDGPATTMTTEVLECGHSIVWHVSNRIGHKPAHQVAKRRRCKQCVEA